MSRLTRTLLFALMAAWLPVTLHCQLEAAGLFDSPDDCCPVEAPVTADSDCKDDACPTVEDALYKESSGILKAHAPAVRELLACFAFLALERSLGTGPDLSTPRHGPPPEWRVSWQFVTRAAPPARAPSLNS